MSDSVAFSDARPAGVGPDGACFSAVDPAWGDVTIFRLGVLDTPRRAFLERRFDLLATWRIHRSLAIKKADVAGRIVVVERAHTTLADVLAVGGMSATAAARMGLDVARALTDMHRSGLVHANLDAAVVGVDGEGRALLDPSGLRCRTVTDPVGHACRASAATHGGEPRVFDDLWALGALLFALAEGPNAAAAFARRARDERSTADLHGGSPLLLIARDLMNLEPAWRPAAMDVARRLHALVEEPVSLADVSSSVTSTIVTGDPFSRPSAGSGTLDGTAGRGDDDERVGAGTGAGARQLGRFRLDAQIGEGAMGRVFRATDVASGEVVAVKVAGLGDDPPSPRAIKRFKKEARILSEIKNPGVAALIDVGEDEDCLWMAVEYVEGETLGAMLKRKGPLGEREALAIVADVCRALIDVHDRGIVHRDIKPENILISESAVGAQGARGTRVKLIDFGIARHLEETASLAMTRQGAVMGTPLYMSPEQARGQHVDTRTDVYAIGSILYELLVGSAPFAGHGASLVLAMQMEKLAPKLSEVRPDASDEVARVVARCLEKDADARPQDAREMLAMVSRLVDGAEPSSIAQHPRAPARDGVSRWTFEWELHSTPRELWPFVSSTDRLNRAIGLGAVEEQVKLDEAGDPVRHGHARQAGFELSWVEHPYEWVLERRIGVLREYSEGPLRFMRSCVDMQELPATAHAGASPRTRLVHTIEVEPRGVLGRAAAAVEIGVKTKRALDRVYRRIDELVAQAKSARPPGTVTPEAAAHDHAHAHAHAYANAHANVHADAFENVEPLSREREDRLVAVEKRVVEQGASPAATARLGDFIRQSPAPELARIRALALARRVGVDEESMVRACLIAAREGMLVPLWDLLCPSCRAPAGIEETLRALKQHAHCEVCNIDFALDLATSIELVFRVHPQLRQADTGTYCLSSPQKTPHVMAQVRVAAGERFALEMSLPEGAYQLVGRRLGYAVSFRARADAPLTRWDLSLAHGPSPELGRVLRAGRQEIVLVNDSGREQLVRIERTQARDDVLTAARVAASPLFRKLYPNEVLSPGALVRIASVVFVHAEVRGPLADAAVEGDVASFSALYAAYKAIETEVGDAGGSVVKLMGDGVLAAFDEPVAAVTAAVRFADAVRRALAGMPATVCAAVHRGPAAAVTLNERLDYFGKTVATAFELSARAKDGEVVVSDDVLADAAVQRVLDDRARGGLMPSRPLERTDPVPIVIA